MNPLLAKSSILLLLFGCLDRFTAFCFRGALPYFLEGEGTIGFMPAGKMQMVWDLLPLLAFVLAAILYDRVPLLRDLRLYLFPVMGGILLLLIGQAWTLFLGYSVLVFISPWVTLNVLLKLFDRIDTPFDDRLLLLYFLANSIVVSIAPFVTGYLNAFSGNLIPLSILNGLLWVAFALYFWRMYIPQTNTVERNHSIPQWTNAYFLGFGWIGLSIYTYYVQLFPVIKEENMRIIPSEIPALESLVLILMLLTGLAFLVVPKFNAIHKLLLALILNLLFGVFLYFRLTDLWLFFSAFFNLLIGLIIYPSLILFLLMGTRSEWRGTILAVFFLLNFSLDPFAQQLSALNFSWLSYLTMAFSLGLLFLFYSFMQLVNPKYKNLLDKE